jgi:secreted Zn-dependent insulinase-like peptidase
LSENGGKFNGMTGEDNTIFSFDVADKMLDEALDIFK